MLLLINYLLVAGMDCVNRPQDQMERVRVLISEEGHQYQQCRYMRMDALETFMLESMASRCQSAHDMPPHHVILVVSTISVHTLAQATEYLLPPPATGWKSRFSHTRLVVRPASRWFSFCRPGKPNRDTLTKLLSA